MKANKRHCRSAPNRCNPPRVCPEKEGSSAGGKFEIENFQLNNNNNLLILFHPTPHTTNQPTNKSPDRHQRQAPETGTRDRGRDREKGTKKEAMSKPDENFRFVTVAVVVAAVFASVLLLVAG